jgi:hypothetical protein
MRRWLEAIGGLRKILEGPAPSIWQHQWLALGNVFAHDQPEEDRDSARVQADAQGVPGCLLMQQRFGQPGGSNAVRRPYLTSGNDTSKALSDS